MRGAAATCSTFVNHSEIAGLPARSVAMRLSWGTIFLFDSCIRSIGRLALAFMIVGSVHVAVQAWYCDRATRCAGMISYLCLEVIESWLG